MAALTASVVVVMMDSATELRLLTLAAASDQQQLLLQEVGQSTHQPAAYYGYSVLIISYHKTGVSSKCVFVSLPVGLFLFGRHSLVC